jgi:hypothetical protein
MPIEKAFRIDASAHRIYSALEEELGDAASDDRGAFAQGAFAVLRRDPDRGLDLRVTIAGVPCWLNYRIEPRDGFSEVVALLQPFGWRYTFFKIVTLGMRDQGFEVSLVEGLANLKAAVEEQEFPDEAERAISSPDE